MGEGTGFSTGLAVAAGASSESSFAPESESAGGAVCSEVAACGGAVSLDFGLSAVFGVSGAGVIGLAAVGPFVGVDVGAAAETGVLFGVEAGTGGVADCAAG